jgi:hypothetical protein
MFEEFFWLNFKSSKILRCLDAEIENCYSAHPEESILVYCLSLKESIVLTKKIKLTRYMNEIS